jgi:ribosome modulation factor
VYDNWRRANQWRANGWRNASNRPVENDDLWKRLLSIRGKLRVRTDIEWTLGKKAPILKAVDKSAKSGAKQPTERDRGYRSGKVGRTKNEVAGAATLFPAAGQRATVRIYWTGVVGRSENKIKFQLLSDSRGDFFDKFVAYAQPEIGALLHRHHTYCVQFNNDPKYPVITGILEVID